MSTRLKRTEQSMTDATTKYRKRPVVIDAVRWTGENCTELDTFIGDGDECEANRPITIETLEGDMTAQIGDWIVRGVRGELYPVKPDIFEQTYELVPNAAAAVPGGSPAPADPAAYERMIRWALDRILQSGSVTVPKDDGPDPQPAVNPAEADVVYPDPTSVESLYRRAGHCAGRPCVPRCGYCGSFRQCARCEAITAQLRAERERDEARAEVERLRTRLAADKRWNDAIDWLLNSRHTADPDIQGPFWDHVDGKITLDELRKS